MRAAFLALTKRFHPARFGRMSPEIQRLSNEVFLAIKSAHDTLLRGSRSGAMPVITDESSAAVRTVPSARQTGAFPATPRPAATQPPPTRPAPPASPATYRGAPVAPAGGTATFRAPFAPGSAPGGSGPTTSRSLTPPAPPAPARSMPTPSTGMPALSRTGTPPPSTGSGGRPATPAVPQHASNAVTRNVRRPSTPPGERSGAMRPREPEFDEQAALQQARDLLATRNWGSARQALQTLAARLPQSRHYRALLCYARGREAHAAGRIDEAALEYQRALQLEPELGLAKQALGELPRRR